MLALSAHQLPAKCMHLFACFAMYGSLLTIGACENPMPGDNVLASGCEPYSGENVSNSIPVRKSGLCKNHAQLHHDPMLLLYHGVGVVLAALHGGIQLPDGW